MALRIHDRFDDDELRRYLTRLSVSVQLHRWGTHSGWVEACHDVGTAVVAPAVGFLAEQWPEIRALPDRRTRGPDADALRDAVVDALHSARRRRPPTGRGGRPSWPRSGRSTRARTRG